MSWIDKVKNGMTIRVGNQKFKPNWMNASYRTEYHNTEFNFVDVDGSFVGRKRRLGVRYNMELYFQGADHLDTSKKFRLACDGTTLPWIIEHPLYDDLTVQISVLDYDNSGLNVTKISGQVIETMQNPPQGTITDPVDQLPIMHEETLEFITTSFKETPTPSDINTMSKNNTAAYKKGVRIISVFDDSSKYLNAYTIANNYIDTATATPILAMRTMTAAIQLPALFASSVLQRISTLIDTFNTFRLALAGSTIATVSSKQIYTSNQASLLAAICKAAANPNGADYRNGEVVFDVLDQITEIFSVFRSDIDSLQTPNAGSPLSFVPDADLMESLDNLVNTTITNLFNIAINSRSQRSIICEKDTNAITLTHRLYGFDAADNNLNELIDNNKLSLDELLLIPKDRKIVYYV